VTSLGWQLRNVSWHELGSAYERLKAEKEWKEYFLIKPLSSMVVSAKIPRIYRTEKQMDGVR
jgi:hypothetical protein